MIRSLSVFLTLSLAVTALAEENWSQFRGPTGRGHTGEAKVPTEWSKDDVAWSTKLKGLGQSSVVNHGAKLFVTSASPDGKERYVECLDRDSGEILWTKMVPSESPELAHKMNSRATPTCAVDGERVIAFFGPAGLHCFDHNGQIVWQRTDLGDFPGDWGVAASPILHGGLVIVNCDTTGPSRLIAVDQTDGSTVWETTRTEKPKGGWSTPILIEDEGQTELVLNGEFGVNGYNPTTGEELWFCKGFNGRGAPVPDYADGVIYVVNGKPGDTYAVKPGGRGDVTATHRLWNAKRGKAGRDLPSPAVVGDYLLISSMSGIANCYDLESGESHWNGRIDLPEVAAAPLVNDAEGLVYFQSVAGGDVVVIRPGKEKEIVATNSIGASAQETFRSTLTPIDGKLYSRSESTVYCIAP